MIKLSKIQSTFYNALYRFKIRNYKSIEGWLTPNEALALYKISNNVPYNGIVVEIGSWKGKSTYCLAKGLNDGIVYAIDPFDASGEKSSEIIYKNNKGLNSLLTQFKTNMRRLKVLSKIKVLKGYSKDYRKYFTNIDFLFIDGDHSIKGCEYDYIHFSRKLRLNGFIAFHDYHKGRMDLGPVYVINKYLLKNKDYKFIGQYDSIWVAQKVK